MYDFPIGAIVDSFRCDTKEAVKKAAAIGIKGLQMYCTRGAHGPENFGKDIKSNDVNDIIIDVIIGKTVKIKKSIKNGESITYIGR